MTDATFTRLSCEEACARLRGGVDSLVLCHARPDADAIGSAFAMRALLSAMGCRAYSACADEIPERLGFLVGDLQESILAANLPSDFVPVQIISVDTASPAQLGDLREQYVDRVDLMIDHHGKGEMYADGWIDPAAAATGEMVYAIAKELVRTGRIGEIPTEIDGLLYAAISSDTGCFRYSNVTPETHRCAAELLRGAADGRFDPADINHRLFEVKSEKLLLAEKLGFERLHLSSDGKVGIVDFPYDLKEKHTLKDEHLETLVDIPRGLEGVMVAAAIRQPAETGVYRISMRSSCDVDVSAVCASFGGGGHVRAAGCTITCEDGMDAVVGQVSEALSAALKDLE